jgi:hypothetical protein
MLERLAEVEEGRAGIDFRPRLVEDRLAVMPTGERIGAMDRRSRMAWSLNSAPTNGRLSSAVADSDGDGSGGAGEQRRMVDGRSRMEMVEWRLGTPTVEVGEGGKSGMSSTGPGPTGAGWSSSCEFACCDICDRSDELEALRPNMRVRDAVRLREDAKSSIDDRLRVESDLCSDTTIVSFEAGWEKKLIESLTPAELVETLAVAGRFPRADTPRLALGWRNQTRPTFREHLPVLRSARRGTQLLSGASVVRGYWHLSKRGGNRRWRGRGFVHDRSACWGWSGSGFR